MKTRHRVACAAAALLALAALVGCSYASMRTIQYIGVPRYPPTDPDKVVILHERPKGGEVRLGEVIVDASIDPAPKVELIEARIRQGTAQLGGDAAVLVVDRTQTVGAVVMGPWWDRSVSTVQDRIVVAVAIKLK